MLHIGAPLQPANRHRQGCKTYRAQDCLNWLLICSEKHPSCNIHYRLAMSDPVKMITKALNHYVRREPAYSLAAKLACRRRQALARVERRIRRKSWRARSCPRRGMRGSADQSVRPTRPSARGRAVAEARPRLRKSAARVLDTRRHRQACPRAWPCAPCAAQTRDAWRRCAFQMPPVPHAAARLPGWQHTSARRSRMPECAQQLGGPARPRPRPPRSRQG
mmetsp:Transcript_10827/g.23574  ORF Transcript_10827/g.23574 Transcript_10827/m.23574 type:complete len:220 (+) Transcript_10827:182-841(+)